MRFVPLTAARWQIPSIKVQLVLAAHVVVVAVVLNILRFLWGYLIKFVQEVIKTKRAPKDRVTLEVDEKRKTEEQEKARLAAWKKRQEAEIVELRVRLQQRAEMPTTTNVPNAAKKRELAAIANRKRQQARMLARPMDGTNAAKQQELAVIAQRKLQQDMMARDHLSSTREEEAEKYRKLTSMMATAERDAKRSTESALANIKAKVADVVEQRLESEEKEEEARYAQEWAAAVTDNTPEKMEDLPAQRELASVEQKQLQPVLIAIANEMNEERPTVTAAATTSAAAATAEEEKTLEMKKEEEKTKEIKQQQQQQFQQERALEEKRAFERYRQERLDEAKKRKENAILKWEAARQEFQQADNEREERRKKEVASMSDMYPLGMSFIHQ